MTSPRIVMAAASNRSEADVRELMRAKLRASDAYSAYCKSSPAKMTEDERIDFELEKNRLVRVMNDADYALHKITSAS